jgi:hypothetical protein
MLYRQPSSGSKGFSFEIALIAAVVDPRIVRASYSCDAVTVTGSPTPPQICPWVLGNAGRARGPYPRRPPLPPNRGWVP